MIEQTEISLTPSGGKGDRLTQYSHGAGCGCKISPKVLDEILKSNISVPDNKNLLVGNSSKDDAAVYDLENGMALISTTDFFMPIVDDAFDFGRIAAANSISDVYAMGGKPFWQLPYSGGRLKNFPLNLHKRSLMEEKRFALKPGSHWQAGIALIHQNPFLV